MSYMQERPALIVRFRAGERSALTDVYCAYVALVDRLVRYQFRIKNPDERADYIQDVFFHAFKLANRIAYDGLRKYGSFLLVLARNLIISMLRHRGHERLAKEAGAVEAFYEAENPDDPEAAHGWLEPKAFAIARAYVATLTGELREVYEARYEQMMSQRDAAEHLGLSYPKLRGLEDQLREELLEKLNQAGIRASNVPSVPPKKGGATNDG